MMEKLKCPCVNWYPESFMSGTRRMTDEEVGIYIRALNNQFIEGGIEPDEYKDFPPKVKVISQEVLSGCWNLKKVTIPDGVVEIGNLAFSMTGIETIDIPNSVKIMDKYIFDECRNFKGVKIPEGVQIID